MKVAHVVSQIRGTTIAPEIATAISYIDGVEVGVAVLSHNRMGLSDFPDIVDESLVIDRSQFRSYIGLFRYLVQNNFDIVHTHHNRTAALVSTLSKLYPVVHVNTQHGHIHYSPVQKAINCITLAASNNITYVSRVTYESYSNIENLLRCGGRHQIIYNGIDLDRIKSAVSGTTLDQPVTMRRLVTASRLIPRKNIESLIRAMEILSNMELVIIGGGERLEFLKKLASDCGVDNRVCFKGYVEDRADVYRIMEACDCFVFPSHSEGFGVAVVEAMALGLPVVASDIAVFREVVGDGGVFVNQNDPAEIAGAIKWLASSPERVRSMGRRNRQRATSQFDYRKVASQYVEMYKQILNDSV